MSKNRYKIKVNTQKERTDAQECFFQLGYGFEGCTSQNLLSDEFSFKYLFAHVDSDLTISNDDKLFSDNEHQEITLSELRDLVVLKRNDVDDATHINTRTNTPYLKQGDNEYYMHNGAWFLSDCPNDLKPITKSETMKEYLNEKYELITSKEELSNLIKVPEGAELAYIYGDNTYFAKPVSDGNGVLMWVLGEDVKWDTTGWKNWTTLINYGFEIVWQRNKPKEFLDPEDGYSLVTAVHALPHWIEVPEGSEGYYQYRKGEDNNEFFLKKIGDTYYYANEESRYLWGWYAGELKGHEFVLWQRNAPNQQHKKLVSIPVEDDEPNNTMNDSDFMILMGQILGNEFTDVQKTLINLALNK